jgi:hypothetical protein
LDFPRRTKRECGAADVLSRPTAGLATGPEELPLELTSAQHLEMLDNVSATAHNLMVQFGSRIYRNAAQRRSIINVASAPCGRLLRLKAA